jgi:type II secretory pathway pseudopilin PulG
MTSSSIIAKATRSAFSLVEVVVSLGIFVIAVVAVIGLLAPINQSISDVRDEDDAGRVAQIIQSELQKVPFAAVQGFIDNNVVKLYANRSGTIVALDTDTAKWDSDQSGVVTADEDAAKFFEVSLAQNAILSPDGKTASYDGGYLAFSILMRWPGYTGEGMKFNQPLQQSLRVIPAAITR